MKFFLSLFLIVMSFSPAWAQLSDEYADWADGPVSFLMTSTEKDAWKAVENDQEAEKFIALFWAKRDPDPGTRTNEFRGQFEARVIAADREFGEENIRGALSDRGKTLILMGTPKEHARSDIGEYLSRIYRTGRPPRASSADPDAHIQMQGVSFNLNRNHADLWGYSRDQLPPGIEWPTREDLITFAFFDTEGNGHYKLQLGIRKSADSIAVLRKMPEALLLHPEMKVLPAYGMIPGVPAATAGELELIEQAHPAEDTAVLLKLGAAGPALPVYWLLYSTPGDFQAADTIVGRLQGEDGETESFRLNAKALNSTDERRVYELAIPASKGGKLKIALFDDGKILDVQKLSLEARKNGEAFMSDIFAGAEVSKQQDVRAGDPFVFGGYHLIPRSNGMYRANEGLALFAVLSLPEGGETSRPGRVRMRWVVDGKSAQVLPSQSVQLRPAGPGLWVWGTQLPLSSMNPEASYLLKISLSDSESGVSASEEIPVRLSN